MLNWNCNNHFQLDCNSCDWHGVLLNENNKKKDTHTPGEETFCCCSQKSYFTLLLFELLLEDLLFVHRYHI